MLANAVKDGIINGPYSIYPSFPCEVYLDGEKHSNCCCKLEAKDTLFSLVHLLGYPSDKVKIISCETGDEVIL